MKCTCEIKQNVNTIVTISSDKLVDDQNVIRDMTEISELFT